MVEKSTIPYDLGLGTIVGPATFFGSNRKAAMHLGLTLATILAMIPFRGDDPASTPVKATLTGTVVLLREELRERGIAADAEVLGDQVALKAADGGLTPLLPNAASLALVEDERLRGRPSEVVGRVIEGVPYLQVVSFRVEEQGELRSAEYYCEICTIDVRTPQACPCCQGEMELRFDPAP